MYRELPLRFDTSHAASRFSSTSLQQPLSQPRSPCTCTLLLAPQAMACQQACLVQRPTRERVLSRPPATPRRGGRGGWMGVAGGAWPKGRGFVPFHGIEFVSFPAPPTTNMWPAAQGSRQSKPCFFFDSEKGTWRLRSTPWLGPVKDGWREGALSVSVSLESRLLVKERECVCEAQRRAAVCVAAGSRRVLLFFLVLFLSGCERALVVLA
ncbi:hypothetical protein B0T10DRAFT_4076 [Thelonectria olida]|uniref:Uncharacterized protein n=1 Tax=Thelonectria olida TaxID=1576542 RepID=A0A9P8WFF0_9HYPO|nr:hypothetical protein B0T10DRAFT_4076 [Thelonectria olida]